MSGYDDIIDLAYEGVQRHPHMSMRQRAAQFQPFAALSGYDALLERVDHRPGERIELGEDEREELDRQLRTLIHDVADGIPVAVTYLDAGHAAVTVEGTVTGHDDMRRQFVFADGTRVDDAAIIRVEVASMRD